AMHKNTSISPDIRSETDTHSAPSAGRGGGKGPLDTGRPLPVGVDVPGELHHPGELLGQRRVVLRELQGERCELVAEAVEHDLQGLLQGLDLLFDRLLVAVAGGLDVLVDLLEGRPLRFLKARAQRADLGREAPAQLGEEPGLRRLEVARQLLDLLAEGLQELRVLCGHSLGVVAHGVGHLEQLLVHLAGGLRELLERGESGGELLVGRGELREGAVQRLDAPRQRRRAPREALQLCADPRQLRLHGPDDLRRGLR
ncbi:MAG: hypothetical protein ACK559_35415, partial [bacterium]